MKRCILAVAIFTLGFAGTQAGEPNQLSAADKAAGWKLLFDGKTTKGWHSFNKETFPSDKWTVVDGWLKCVGKGGGDVVSADLFEQFELEWDWKLVEGGNSGLKYFVVASRGAIGHEYQMLDDDKHADAKLGAGKRVTAAFYDVLKPAVKTPLKPPGQVNHSRVVVNGNHVEHWLNGVKVLEYECGSPEIKAAVADSKFNKSPDFGSRLRGHILLQDHNAEVCFQNVRIREIAE